MMHEILYHLSPYGILLNIKVMSDNDEIKSSFKTYVRILESLYIVNRNIIDKVSAVCKS